MEKLKHLLIEAKTSCPAATQDVHVNLENRQHAIDELRRTTTVDQKLRRGNGRAGVL